MSTYILASKDELYHYGVKGMRWGIRKKYDPHPRKKSSKQKRHIRKEKSLTDKQKKYIKIGAAAATTALAVYGGYKLYKSGNLDGIIDKGKNILGKDKSGKQIVDEYVSFGNGIEIKRMNKNLPIEEDIKLINPKFSIFNKNYNMNCGNCTIGFELRRRGFDVEALGNSEGMKISHLGEFFSGLKSNSFIQMNVDDKILRAKPSTERGKAIKQLMSSNISKQYDGNARGTLFFPHTMGSHWINWVKEGNEVKFYDGQNPKIDLVNDLFAHYKYNPNLFEGGLTSVRLDDLDIKQTIWTMVKNRGDKYSGNANFNAHVDRGKNFVTDTLTRR